MQKYYLAHKFRLDPTREQRLVLTSWCHINRYVWNHFLNANKEQYNGIKKFIFYHEMATSLPKLKKEHSFLKEPPSQSLQSICQRLESAIKRVWQTDNGFPRFKSKKRGDLPSIQIPNGSSQIEWTKTKIKIPKLGFVKWTKHRRLSGRLVSITIKYEGDHWWIVALCESKKLDHPINDDVAGIDLGLKNWITTSDGEVFDLHPDLLDREKKVIKEQKKLSKKKKDSNNRTKQRLKLKRAHLKVRFARNDNAHKVSSAIAKQYSCVAIEDLNIKGMMKNRNLARKIAQASWGRLRTCLSYKTNVKLVNRWYPSTKTCSSCGHKQPMPLNVRTYECGNCGLVIDRDVNAAINIKQITFGTKGNYACGDTSHGGDSALSPSDVSLNQENFKADGDIFSLETCALKKHE